MPETSFTRDQLESLAAKLDALDLTDDEQALLNSVFEAADAEAEVSGFAVFPSSPGQHLLKLFGPTYKPDLGDGAVRCGTADRPAG